MNLPPRDDLSVIFTTSSGIVSRLIRYFMGSRVSHAAFHAIVLGVPVVIHADFGGVQVNTFQSFAKKNRVVQSFPVEIDSYEKLSGAISRVGESYDYAGLFGFLSVVVWRWLGVKRRNPFASSKSVVCSEFVVSVLRLPLPKEETTPEDLRRYLEAIKKN